MGQYVKKLPVPSGGAPVMQVLRAADTDKGYYY
jgi:hypothetical protein